MLGWRPRPRRRLVASPFQQTRMRAPPPACRCFQSENGHQNALPITPWPGPRLTENLSCVVGHAIR